MTVGAGRFVGRVAIVTGGSSGIGAATASRLAAEGAAVALTYRRGEQRANDVVEAIVNAGGSACAVRTDVADEQEVDRLFDKTAAKLGPPSILINNAGVYGYAPIESVAVEQYRDQFDTNVLGPVLTVREAAVRFPPGGSILNISSAGISSLRPSSSVYAGSKAALTAMTTVWARELGPRNIRVNALAPGFIPTEGTSALAAPGSDWERLIVERTPLGRLGSVNDITGVAMFLVSDDAGWITGETIFATGGYR